MANLSELREFQKDTLKGLIDATVENRVPTFADKFMPQVPTYSTTFAYDIIQESQHIAAQIGIGSEPPVIDRDKVASMHGKIAKFGIKYIATEEELLAIFQARNSGEKQAVLDKLLTKATDLAMMVQRRFDVAKIQALTIGKYVYDDNNVKVDVDFGIPAAHKVELTGAEAWTDAAADPIADLMDWVEIYRKENGRKPEIMYFTPKVLSALMKNPQVVLEAGRPSRATQQDVADVFASYGLPSFEIVEETSVIARNVYTGVDEEIEIFPENRIVMLSEGIGEFLVGPTVENGFAPGIFVDAYDKKEPIESILRAVAAGFPTVVKPQLIFHADVIA